MKINLPKKDSEGKNLLSYSQINTFKRDRSEYWQQYIKGRAFVPNVYTDFGNKVGNSLETNDFSAFTPSEVETLKQVPRLDEFERMITLDFGEHNFYMKGFIDTNLSDFLHLIDYKTGGKGKEIQYYKPNYTQLCYYALALRQETGITPKLAQVVFVEREGNPKKGQELKVASAKPIVIDIDITYRRLVKVYHDTIQIAKEITEFYRIYKPKDDSLLPTLD